MVQNINRFTPLVSVYTLHCNTAPRRENSQISLWILQDQSSWECLQAENVFAFFAPFLNCFWKCLKHKIAGKSKPLKELWGETLIYSNEKYWNIFLRIFSRFSLRNNMWQWLGVGDGSVRSLDPAISWPYPRKVALHVWLSSGPWRGCCGTFGRSETQKGQQVPNSEPEKEAETSPGISSFLPRKLEFSLSKRQFFPLQCIVVLIRNTGQHRTGHCKQAWAAKCEIHKGIVGI